LQRKAAEADVVNVGQIVLVAVDHFSPDFSEVYRAAAMNAMNEVSLSEHGIVW
jgi:hypothetical protein